MSNKLNVVLDLDNTIINSEANTEFPFMQEGIREKVLSFSLYDMDGYYIVFERPYLQNFLDYVFKNFNVLVWTAATKDYALFIIFNIILKDPNRKIDFLFFNNHCKLSNKLYKSPKNLRLLNEKFGLDYT